MQQEASYETSSSPHAPRGSDTDTVPASIELEEDLAKEASILDQPERGPRKPPKLTRSAEEALARLLDRSEKRRVAQL
ncbi:MAG TPA: hypothetical protein VFX59_08495, partial [Polyangiales bacterium]|nr:hypothetical protein [Polyangiales bacterium]